jgi:Transcriptional regulators
MKNHLSNELRELLRILIRDLGILEKSDASCCGISLAQCHAIVEIGRADKISLVDLAEILGLDKSTMSRTINNLVDAGLVLRDLDMENRRYVIIQLTDNGKSIYQNTEESMNSYYQDVFNSIPEDKREQIIESLQLLTSAVEENRCC